MRKTNCTFLFFITALIGCKSETVSTQINSTPIIARDASAHRIQSQAVGQKFALATQGDHSTKAAQQMFSLGGNIIDAAIAASFTLAVERPQSTGISGGGFFLFYEAKTKKTYAIDFRERGPHLVKENMFIDKNDVYQKSLSKNGILAVAVPGLVAGLYEIHQKFGSLPFEKTLEPAIHLAENGFPIYPNLSEALLDRAEILRQDPAASSIFLAKDLKPWPVGHILVQKDLAASLRKIQKKGRDGFYKGSIAKALIQLSKKENGLIDQKDLDNYHVHWREPLHGQFHGYEIFTMPPPSSGGVHVLQFLNILERDHLAKYGIFTAKSIHLAAAALQEAFADRAQFLGDPDFSKIPVQALISLPYAESRRREISLDRARKASEVKMGNPQHYESSDTTHFSIMDDQGNAVASTQTINGWMGAGIVIPGTGIVLNNEMDDFTAQVGTANMFGAIGGKPNSIEPGKTPLSSMSPTIIIHNKKPILSLGAPGGTRIISCVAQTILNYLEYKLPLYESIASIRYHHQWQPDILQIEMPGPTKIELKKLQDMGYEVSLSPVGCNVMAVAREGNSFHAVADPRDIGTSASE
jgi:gamma-glutamyltranspeptidase/glutathione hydrolase